LTVSQSKVLRKELLDLLEVGVEDTPETTDNDPTEWNIRNTLSAEKWKEARPSLIDNMLANEDPHPQSGCQCGKPAVVRCLDCLPLPLLCLDCDLIVHSRFVLHNREQLNGEFLQPVPHQQTGTHLEPLIHISHVLFLSKFFKVYIKSTYIYNCSNVLLLLFFFGEMTFLEC